MNKKGFTLIELLAVIVVLGVVLLLAMPSILDSINASRDSSYKILIGNIKTAAETYYQECEYGDLSDPRMIRMIKTNMEIMLVL